MYVSGLDRPWTQTPYPLQGFHINSVDDIDDLRRFCKWVQVDTQLSRATDYDALATAKPANNFRQHTSAHPTERTRASHSSKNTIRISPLPINKRRYIERAPLASEMSNADTTFGSLRPAIEQVMTSINNGQTPNLSDAIKTSNAMVDSIIRNPDAFSWISRVRKHDEHTFDHSIRATIWAIIFGRHIGLERDKLYTLAQATLLKDTGTLKINKQVLRASPRTDEQQAVYETHILHCIQSLKGHNSVSAAVIDAIHNHCERLDGTGYPRGLVGDAIPFLSKIIGLVTLYDDIVNPRYSTQPLSPSKAISALYLERNKGYQEELVVEFIQAVGIYPTGTLVELNSGEIGVVVEQSPKRRLRPVVMLVTDNTKKPLRKPKPLDLYKTSQSKNGFEIEIARDLEADACNVDLQQIQAQYLKPQEKGGISRLFDRLMGNG